MIVTLKSTVSFMTGSLLNNKVIITGKPEIINCAMPEVMKSKFYKPCPIIPTIKHSVAEGGDLFYGKIIIIIYIALISLNKRPIFS